MFHLHSKKSMDKYTQTHTEQQRREAHPAVCLMLNLSAPLQTPASLSLCWL